MYVWVCECVCLPQKNVARTLADLYQQRWTQRQRQAEGERARARGREAERRAKSETSEGELTELVAIKEHANTKKKKTKPPPKPPRTDTITYHISKGHSTLEVDLFSTFPEVCRVDGGEGGKGGVIWKLKN